MSNTKANLKPAPQNTQWMVTTQVVEDYLQKKLDSIQTKGVTVNVATLPLGDKFKPFLVILSPNALKSQQTVGRSNIPKIFKDALSDNENSHHVELYRDVYTIFSEYVYNKNDQNYIMSPTFKRDHQLKLNAVTTFKTFRTPSIQTVNEGRLRKYVALIIDPLRIFNDMVRDTTNDDIGKYIVSVIHTKSISDSNTEYIIEKIFKKSDKTTVDAAAIIANSIRSKVGK